MATQKTITAKKALFEAEGTGTKKYSTLKAAIKDIKKNLAEIHTNTHAKLIRGRR